MSKAYQLIDRFSEDIDLSVSRHITNGEHKKAKQQILEIADSLGLTLDNPEDIRSRRDYNKYLFSYDSLFRSESMSLMIETSFFNRYILLNKYQSTIIFQTIASLMESQSRFLWTN